MKNGVIYMYFRLINFLLYTVAAIPEHKELKTASKTFLFNKVWPVYFVVFWIPLAFSVMAKVVYTITKENWEDLLDIMHMFLLGINTLYLVVAVQQTRKSYKLCMDEITMHFFNCNKVTLKDFKILFMLMFIIANSLCFYISTSIYYGELLVPVYIPFLNNDEDFPTVVFLLVFTYEMVAGMYMVIAYGFLVPFVIVATGLAINELDYLILKLDQFKYKEWQITRKTINLPAFKFNKELLLSVCENESTETVVDNKSAPTTNHEESFTLNDSLMVPFCTSEKETKQFVKRFVEHHYNVKRVISFVSNIHNYVFFTQYMFTTSHSCFLAFSMYYTERLSKVVVKSSPILVLSYYLLFIYCWNGQRLSDKVQEVSRALYSCYWTNCPHSFKKSLLIMVQSCQKPVKLSGGLHFSASLHTFLEGVQQSFSYILLLKELTPDHSSS